MDSKTGGSVLTFKKAPTFQAVRATTLSQFLIHWTNTILLQREVYPRAAFVQVQAYSTSLQVCQHPRVREYLDHVQNTAEELLSRDTLLRTVVLQILNARQPSQMLERHIIRFAYPFMTNLPREAVRETDIKDMEVEFRELFALYQSQDCDPAVRKCPDKTFAIDLETDAEGSSIIAQWNSLVECGMTHADSDIFSWILKNGSDEEDPEVVDIEELNEPSTSKKRKRVTPVKRRANNMSKQKPVRTIDSIFAKMAFFCERRFENSDY